MSVFLSFTLTVVCITSLSAWELSETVNAVVGHSAELPCNITVANPEDKLVVVAWYKNGSETAFFSRDLRKGSRAAAGGRYQLVEGEGEDRLQLHDATPGDAGLYQCVADFALSPARTTYVLLNIIEPPQWLWVVQENESRVASARAGANASRKIGPYYIGDVVHLFCVAFEGRPRATLSWWSDNKLLENKTTQVSEQRVRSDVALPPLRREDHGRVVSCRAENNDVTPPLTVDIIIDMYLPPELISVRSLGEDGSRTHAEDTLTLQCRVLGARPPPPVEWRLGDAQLLNLEQNVTSEQSQRLVVSEVRLTIDHTWDEARLRCCVRARRSADDPELTCSQPLPLTVLYPPVLEIVPDLEPDNCTLHVVKGSNVTLNCTVLANPPAYQLLWFYEDDMMADISNDTNIDSFRILNNVTEKDSGIYVCAAINSEGSTHSDPLVIDVIYPAYCEDTSIAEYGVGADESVNLTCNVKANPAPVQYGWAVLNKKADPSIFGEIPDNAVVTENPTFTYTRPNDTAFSTVLCWGINDVTSELAATPCAFLVTDQTAPRPPAACRAVEENQEISITCERGHDGGLPQKFKLIARSSAGDVLVSITNLEPKFLLKSMTQDNFKFEIVAYNEKGVSKLVEIDKESIIHKSNEDGQSQNMVANITTLALALCGGVLLVALVACGLVLCARDRAEPRAPNPPLCAYTEETTYNDSDDSECNIRRTESFRRAMARYPSKNFDVRRTSSFHSTRYLHDFADLEPSHKHNDILRHSPSCRVHSMQNIHRRRDMDGLSDHLATHLPPDLNYVPITTNTFHTMPKKMRHKLSKEISDEASVITQMSDGFSLPPPPDEFGTYRAGTRIKDMPKPPASYTAVVRKNSSKKDKQPQQFNNVIISPMNTVGLPAAGPSGAYSYQDEDGRQELLRTPGVLTTFQTYSSPKESGL